MSSDADSAADPVCIVSCNLEYSGLRCKCKRCIYSSCKCSFKDTGYTAVLADTVGNQVNFQRLGYTANSAIDALYKFKPADWTAMAEKFPDLSGMISQTTGSLDTMNYFLGLNISNSPMTAMVENFKAHNWILFVCALAIPVLAGLSQWLNTRLMPQAAASPAGDDSSMESSMKMMNNMMPLVSVFFCLSLPIGLGIYWIAGAVFRGIQQVVVNKHMEKMDMDALIRKNVEKMNAKRKKQGLPPKKISEHAKVNFKDLEDARKVDEKKQAERQKKSRILRSTINTQMRNREVLQQKREWFSSLMKRIQKVRKIRIKVIR